MMMQIFQKRLVAFLIFLPTQKKQTTMPNIIVLCGPSGAGKTTLSSILVSTHPDKFKAGITHTTREPRPGEENGVDYHFVAKSDMLADIAAGLFVESATVHGNLYGLSTAAVESVLATGRKCVLIMNIDGCQALKKIWPARAAFVFVRPPSVSTIEERLTKRGDKPDSIPIRLLLAEEELRFRESHPDFFDATITNKDIDLAAKQLLEFALK